MSEYKSAAEVMREECVRRLEELEDQYGGTMKVVVRDCTNEIRATPIPPNPLPAMREALEMIAASGRGECPSNGWKHRAKMMAKEARAALALPTEKGS